MGGGSERGLRDAGIGGFMRLATRSFGPPFSWTHHALGDAAMLPVAECDLARGPLEALDRGNAQQLQLGHRPEAPLLTREMAGWSAQRRGPLLPNNL